MPVHRRDTGPHKYADYLVWSREYGDELIDGVAYIREPPAPSFGHQDVLYELVGQLRRAHKGTGSRACGAPLDVRLPKNGEPDDQVDTVVQPDAFIVSDPNKLDHRGVRGAPDWVAEILSPSTASHDRTTKLSASERAGVREVWLIHPVDRKLTLYRLEPGGLFSAPCFLELKGQTRLTAVPGVTVDWDQLLSDLGWSPSLAVRT
jgi:Uma2 family endonuclease